MLKKELEQTLAIYAKRINKLTHKVSWYENILFYIGFGSGICAMSGFFGWININPFTIFYMVVILILVLIAYGIA